jgi:very-short-patch-repair endonuclease
MYDQKKKELIGRLDGTRISNEYEMRLRGFEKTLGAKPTPAELHFEEHIARVISLDAQTPYKAQRVLYISDTVGFFADFYFKKFRVVVEIDGSSHYGERAKEYDTWRDGLLNQCGIAVIRFSNKAVLQRTIETFNATVRFLGDADRATPSHKKHLRKVYSHLIING